MLVSAKQANCTNGEVRLVGGSGPHEGRVEICLGDSLFQQLEYCCCQSCLWTIGIFSNRFYYSTTTIYCIIDLGGKAKSNAYFGLGTGPILLSDLYCTGTESSLLECSQQSCYVTSCTHSNDVGVICECKI